MRTLRRLIAVALVAAPIAITSAQEPRRLNTPDSIPTELATALIGAGGLRGEPLLLVGALPEWLSSRIVIPPTARVLGAASVGNNVIGAYSAMGTPEAAIGELKTALLSHGWKTPPPTPNYGGGFRPATMLAQLQSTGPTTLVTLCREEATLTASAVRARGEASTVTLRLSALNSPMTYSTCNPPPRPEMSANRPTIPTLYDPPISGETTNASACYPTGGGFGSNGTGTFLRSTLAPDAILEHYSKQLVDSGWVVGSSTMTVARTFTRRDSTGATVEATITVAPSRRSPSCRDVNLQLQYPSKP